MKLDNIPIEWLEQILSFCSITDLHRNCILVNKEWEVATRYVLKQRKSVKIVHKNWTFASDSEWDRILISDFTDPQALLKSLSQMTSIEELEVNRWFVSDGSDSKLVLQKSDNLKSVRLNAELPLESDTKYPKLQRLECHNFDSVSAAKACPKLKHLRANGLTAASALIALKPEAIETLDVNVTLESGVTASDLVTHLLRMERMKELVLYLPDESDGQSSGAIFWLFYGFPNLRYLSLTFKFMASDDDVAEDAVRELVRRHPLLEYLDLSGSSFKPLSLAALAELQHLKVLYLNSMNLSDKSPDPVLRFLRESASRAKLQRLLLSFEQQIDCESIMDEIRVMEGERGGQVLKYTESFDGRRIQFEF